MGLPGHPTPLATYPEANGRAALNLSIWSCSEWGLPCHLCHHKCGELLPRRFTLTRQISLIGGLFSVALSIGHPMFVLRTILPCGVRTFLSGSYRSDHAPTPCHIIMSISREAMVFVGQHIKKLWHLCFGCFFLKVNNTLTGGTHL